MSPADRDALLETLFHRALETPPGEREAILATCDAELAGDLRGLLAAHRGAPAVMERAGWAAGLLDGASEAVPGARIGNYLITGRLGEGGMGSVHRARQLEPLVRDVALKLVKPGMDTREVLARFEDERRLLARLSHPHIAAVHDAGVTPRGRPFFVMELVDGEPITRFCDRRRLDLAARLRLFVTVCDAVQHAHCKGVLHRDIKPGNVLVGDAGGTPVPKVIDFGVAKAFEAGARAGTLATRLGQLVGTPGYMSPEQAAGDSSRIDTRSDVYALGVLLCELLSGELPVDVAGLAGAPDDVMRRRLLEQEPSRPSVRLLALGPAARRRRAARRSSDPRAHAQALARGLDWIVMKALAPVPGERYASASGLASDVGAWLAGQPISAGPPALSLRLLSLARRRRWPAAAAAAVVLATWVAPSWLALQQAGRLEVLEETLAAADEILPPRREQPLPEAPQAACPACTTAFLTEEPADLVLVRNAGDRALQAGELLELVSEAPASTGGRARYDVRAARAGSGQALLGVLLRGADVAGQHLHAADGAVAVGAVGQAVARGSLTRVRVDGPVAPLARLGASSLAGAASAETGEGSGAWIGTVQAGWPGPGPGFARVAVSPSWDPMGPAVAAAGAGSAGLGSGSGLVAPSAQGPGAGPGAGGGPPKAGPVGSTQGKPPAGKGPTVDPPDDGSKPINVQESAGLRGAAHAKELLHASGVDPRWRELAAGAPSLDLRLGGRPGAAPVLPNDSSADDGALPLLESGGSGTAGLATHWFDHDLDAYDDLLIVRDGALTLLRNLGQDLFEDVTARVGFPQGLVALEVIPRDFDADGRTDLVVRDDDGALRLLLCRGGGTLVDATPGSGLDALGALALIEPADPDGDGVIDLLALTTSRVLLLLGNDGGARFAPLVIQQAPAPEADFEGEGDALPGPSGPAPGSGPKSALP